MNRFVPILAVLAGLGGGELHAQAAARASPDPLVCRCAERTLEAYYSAAEEVLVARMDRAEEGAGERLLHMEAMEIPWKRSDRRPAPVRVGDPIRYVTASSTAACGMQPVVGAIYVVFAFADPASDDALRVDTCSGTRVFRTETGAEPRGFTGVPGRFVHAQLDALSGLDVLQRMTAGHPDPSDPDNSILVGLLDLEALAHGGEVPVRAEPRPDAPVIHSVDDYADVDSREVGYEVGAAVVYARVDDWSRIRLADGANGWVAPDDAGTWFPYRDLPVRRLAYLTAEWSGHLWPEPGAGIPARSSRVADGLREYPVDVVESAMVGGTVWFRVRVYSQCPCESGDERTGLAGWVPGYYPAGDPLVWYYSRGC